jgi:hypothetical protein
MSRISLCLFAFVAMLGLTFTVASAGDLKKVRDAQTLAAQKLIQDVDNAIEASRKQAPIDAKYTLRRMISRINESDDLVAGERKAQLSRLQNRLTLVENAIRAKTIVQEQTPPTRDTPRYQPPANDPGKGVSGFAKNIVEGRKDTVQIYGDLDRQRNQGNIAIARDNAKPLPLDKEMTFPADWKEKQARRVNGNLTDKEVKLLKTLNSTLSIDYNDDDFKGVLNNLMERTKLTIIVDEASMQEANVDYKDKVTLKFPKMTVRTALKKILGDKGLTYIIKEGNIQVMTPKKASEYTVVRTYTISDLVTPDPRLNFFNPYMAQFQKIQAGNQIVALIQNTIEPSYWQPNGPGTIIFEPTTGALIVRASAELHYQLGSPGLFGGR